MLSPSAAGRPISGGHTDALLARHKLINEPPPLATGRTDLTASGFEAIVMRMIQRTPQDRYQSADEVFSELAALRSGQAPAALTGSSPHASSSPQASSLRASSPQVSSPQVSSPQVSSPRMSSPHVSSPDIA